MRIHPWAPRSIRRTTFAIVTLAACAVGPRVAMAQNWPSYAGGPQHNGISPFRSQPLQKILWSAPVDLQPEFFGVDLNAHYGSPVITAKNTVIVPLKSGFDDSFGVAAYSGSDGALIWQLASDYIQPSHSWTLPFQITLTRAPWPWPARAAR